MLFGKTELPAAAAAGPESGRAASAEGPELAAKAKLPQTLPTTGTDVKAILWFRERCRAEGDEMKWNGMTEPTESNDGGKEMEPDRLIMGERKKERGEGRRTMRGAENRLSRRALS